MYTMKICIISDTHNKHRALTLPDADMLVHAGDATMSGTLEEVASFGNWFRSLPHPVKLFVPGNHDFLFEKQPAFARELLAGQGVHVLIDQPFIYKRPEGDIRFYGTPWVPDLVGWAFYGDGTALTSRFHNIPDGTEVLITHGPPLGVLDKGRSHFGSGELGWRVKQLAELKLHCFGHIHEGYGRAGGLLSGHYTVNASCCNEDYELVNPPIVVEI